MDKQLTPIQQSLIDFLSSEDTILEYERTFDKGENVYINVSDPKDPYNKYFQIVTCDEFSTRAAYKLDGMEDESTIVVEINNREDDRCDLYIRSLDFTLQIRS